jgi:hypothetical protein
MRPPRRPLEKELKRIMSVMHGPRHDKEYREKQYRLFFKFAIALGIMIVLVAIANIVGAGA